MAKKHQYWRRSALYREILHTRLTAWRRLKVARLSEAQGHRCAYCCKRTYLNKQKGMDKRDRATLEHLIPKCEPVQTNKDDNLVMACSQCNVLRGITDPIKFYQELRRKVINRIEKQPTQAQIEKVEVKYARTMALVYLIVVFWPEQAQKIIESPPICLRVKKPRMKWSKQIHQIRCQVNQDPKALAA